MSNVRKINLDLQAAIRDRKCDRVKQLLADGADINHAINSQRDTMLHHAASAGVVYDILGYSADVAAKNARGKTPMHTAAEMGKPAAVFQALVAHCGQVNERDFEGNIALNYAVRRVEKKYDVIKELVMMGSQAMPAKDILWDPEHLTPLDEAVQQDDLECIKFLIKYHILCHFSRSLNSKHLVEYFRHQHYREMVHFYDDCMSELKGMDRDIVHERSRSSLLTVMRKRFEVGEEERDMDAFATKCFKIIKSRRYPIYNDHVIAKVKHKLDRRCLVKFLWSLVVYVRVYSGKVRLGEDLVGAGARGHAEANPKGAIASLKTQPIKTEASVDAEEANPIALKGTTASLQTQPVETEASVDAEEANPIALKITTTSLQTQPVETEVDLHQNLNLNPYVVGTKMIPHKKVVLDAYTVKTVIFPRTKSNPNALKAKDSPKKEFTVKDQEADKEHPINTELKSNIKANNGKEKERIVTLSKDLARIVSGYLPTSDLFNWIIAYYIPSAVRSEIDNNYWSDSLSRKVFKRLSEGSLTAYNLSKVPKLQ